MKLFKILIILSVIGSIAFGQFTAGTKTISGSISWTKVKDDDGSLITAMPSGGYFFMDNLLITGSLEYLKYSEDDDAMTGIGFGAKYFMGNIYGGGSFYTVKYGDSDNVNQLVIEGGMLMNLSESVYIDLGLDYFKGLGDYDDFGMTVIGAGVIVFF
jgi:hypothetical protein